MAKRAVKPLRKPLLEIDIVTLFPSMFEGPLTESIVQRAQEKGALKLGYIDPREFTQDRHRTVDDRPFGGGAGMLMMAEPLYQAIKKVRRKGSTVVFLSPQGKVFDQKAARRLAKAKHLVLVCGRYEGVDERVLEYVDEELSIGDFVLTGGELPAMVVADATARLLPGVLEKADAAANESFEQGVLDYPQYTRPRVWRGQEVPEELLSGNHKKVAEWRQGAARRATRKKRPNLLKNKV
jgi:tRNA (guanine37-N1)-methyltransferase